MGKVLDWYLVFVLVGFKMIGDEKKKEKKKTDSEK